MAKPPKKDNSGAAGTAPAERRRGAYQVGALLPDIGGNAFRRFGFQQGALVARWREVVGPVYARWSVPQAIRFPPGSRVGATLVVRVQGPFALQLQHVAPQLVERANRILGAGVISRLKLVQGEVPAPEPAPVAADAPAKPAHDPGVNLAGVADPGLRAALEALSAALARAKGPPRIS